MRLENVFVILKREYLQRVRNKGFWIATLAVPLFAALVSTLPGLLVLNSHPHQTIVVADGSGRGIGEALKAQMAKAKTTPQTPKPDASIRRKPPDEEEKRTADFAIERQAAKADPQAQRRELDSRVRHGKIEAWLWIGPGVLTDQPVEYHARST